MKYIVVVILFLHISCQEIEKTTLSSQPNVLLILTDDQGWGDLSIHGNKDLKTPHIDKLFQDGTEFENFYVSPVCSPTRAELLTGRYHVRSGVYSTSAGGERMDLNEETIAEIFSRNGYNTGAFGKWHNGTQYPYHPNGRGFDEYYGFASGHWGHYFSPMLEHNQQIVTGEGYLPDDLTQKAIDFIDNSIKENRPFFTYIPYNTPHSPMQVPEEYWLRHDDDDLEMDHPDKKENALLHTRAALAMVENIDDNVGRLITHLGDEEILDNTIVIFLSDNGPNGNRWNNCMKGRKGSTDEGGVKSPFAIQWKGTIPSQHKVKSIASAIDILPTLSDLCELTYRSRKNLDGQSITSQIMKTDIVNNDRLIFNHWRGKVSVRSQQYRLSADDTLYDLQNDPCQHTDISKTKVDIFNQLEKAKQDWIENVLVELPETDDRTFTIGHPSSRLDHLPARDAYATGNLIRSNRYPNDSYWLNWKDMSDSIKWDVEVLEPGTFEASIYYTAEQESVGSKIKLSYQNRESITEITEAHDPPVVGAKEDKFPRAESYVKNFKELNLGKLDLVKGKDQMVLSPEYFAGDELIEFRLLVLKRV